MATNHSELPLYELSNAPHVQKVSPKHLIIPKSSVGIHLSSCYCPSGPCHSWDIVPTTDTFCCDVGLSVREVKVSGNGVLSAKFDLGPGTFLKF